MTEVITHSHFYSLAKPSVSQDGTITSISLIKLGDAEGHFDRKGRQETVDETTLLQVFNNCKMLESVKVKADHGSGVFSTIGWVDNFSLTNNKVLADFHIYENEPQRGRLLEIAQKNPEHMGMSLEFEGKDENDGVKAFARCEKILAVALVSDPAANSSLFSISQTKSETKTKQMEKEPEGNEMAVEPTPTELATMYAEMKSCYEELAMKFSAYEDGKTEEVAPEPVAVDPEKEPAKKMAEPDATKEDEDEKQAKMAELGAARAIKMLSSKLGLISLGRSGVGGITPTVKTYSEIVKSETTRFDGDKVKAEAFILSQISSNEEYKKAYVAHRNLK